MTIEAGTATPEAGAVTSPPAPLGVDEFSAGEKAFRETGDMSALIAELPEAERARYGWTKPAAAAPNSPEIPDGSPTAASDSDEPVEGEVVVGDDGATRDAKTGRFVPKAAFVRKSKEAQEHKAAAAEAAARAEKLRDQFIAARERLAIYQEATAPEAKSAPAPEAAIDPAQDIFGAFAQLKKQLEDLKGGTEKTAAETRAQLERRELQDFFQSDVTRFQASTPDFGDAVAHAVAAQDKLLQLTIDDPGERKQAVIQAIHSLITNARQAGKSPARALYDAAKVLGYAKPAAPAADPAKAQAAAAEIERINAGQVASATLRGAGTTGNAGQVTRAQLADMSDAEYSRAKASIVAKHGAAYWSQLTGV